MGYSTLSIFVLSWRGFLLGSRRGWHAHHRGGIAGVRGGLLVAGTAAQHVRLVGVVSLATAVLSRGGQIWGFGLGVLPPGRWGRLWGRWRPGVLSNYFYVRLRRVYSAGRVGRLLRADRNRPHRVYQAGHRAGRRAGLAAVTTRFARQAWGHPPRSPTYAGRWWLVAAWRASPYDGWDRVRYLRRWWRTTLVLSRWARTPGGVRWFFPGGPTAVVKPELVRAAAAATLARHHRRRGRVTVAAAHRWKPTSTTTTVVVPPRLSRRHRGRRISTTRVAARIVQGTPYFPAAVAAGGLSLLGSNLVYETNSVGVPLLHFGGSDFVPTAVVWHVTWNQSSDSLRGVAWLLPRVYQLAATTATLAVVWRRLGGRLAEW